MIEPPFVFAADRPCRGYLGREVQSERDTLVVGPFAQVVIAGARGIFSDWGPVVYGADDVEVGLPGPIEVSIVV